MAKIRRILIAVPSYWVFGRKKKLIRDSYELYDHPTTIPRYETLTRLLGSLNKLDTGGLEVKTVILIAARHERKRYKELIKRLVDGSRPRMNLSVMFETRLGAIKKELADLGYPMVKDEIGLEGYSNVRNAALFLAQLSECDAVFFLDDDVVINDGKVLKKLVDEAEKDDRTGVVGGVYTNEKGSHVLNEKTDCWKHFWNKNKHINQAYRDIGEGNSGETVLLFGGNMLITRDAFARVPFDPLVPRGEDIDYAINAKHFKFKVLLRKDAGVIHLPPENKKSYLANYWSRLRGDISRFIYEREKMSVMGMPTSELPVYPRIFMRNIRAKAVLTTLMLLPRSIALRNFDSTKENILNLKKFFWDLPRRARKHKRDYFRFQRDWESLMSVIESERELGNAPRGWWL